MVNYIYYCTAHQHPFFPRKPIKRPIVTRD